MSDTPRTQAEIEWYVAESGGEVGVSIYFARTLERELAQARRNVDDLAQAAKENDRLRADLCDADALIMRCEQWCDDPLADADQVLAGISDLVNDYKPDKDSEASGTLLERVRAVVELHAQAVRERDGLAVRLADAVDAGVRVTIERDEARRNADEMAERWAAASDRAAAFERERDQARECLHEVCEHHRQKAAQLLAEDE